MFNIDLKRYWYEVLKHLNHFKCLYSHVIPSIFHKYPINAPFNSYFVLQTTNSGAIDKWIHLIFAPAPNLRLCRKRDIALPQWRPPWRTYAAGAMIRDVWMLWRSKWSKMYPYIYGWWLIYGNLRMLMNGMIGARFQNVWFFQCVDAALVSTAHRKLKETPKKWTTLQTQCCQATTKRTGQPCSSHIPRCQAARHMESSRSFQVALAMFISTNLPEALIIPH